MAFIGSLFSSPLNNLGSANSTAPIVTFRNALGRYPGNNKQWWVAKAQADDDEKRIKEGQFLPLVLDKLYSGNNKAPRGHFFLNAFRKERGRVSGLGPAVEDTKELGYRPNTTTFYSGRAWWAGGDRVFYSMVIDHKSKSGLCYQEADATAEDISDLIATDGGTIHLSESKNIHRIMPLSTGVMAFSTNGVWFISGGRGGFSATDISLDKVSSVGTDSPHSIVQVNDMIFWWSEIGICALEQASGQFGPIPGKFGNNNISEQTIQSYYNAIPEECRRYARGIYDPKNNVVQWLFSSNSNKPRNYNRILNYDVTLQAFYPWEISSHEGTSGPVLKGVFMTDGLLREAVADDVFTIEGGIVISNSLDNVETLVYNTTVEDRPTNLMYTARVGASVTFADFNNRDFVDWESFDESGVPYLSYVETGYELLEDAMRKKQTPRIFIHFRRTEDDPSSPPSSCTFRTKWDWTKNANSNKWSRAIEAYRPKTMRLPSTADFESGMPVVISNNKVRGSGKAVQFRFECSEPGKNFDLLGWSVAYSGNTEP